MYFILLLGKRRIKINLAPHWADKCDHQWHYKIRKKKSLSVKAFFGVTQWILLLIFKSIRSSYLNFIVLFHFIFFEITLLNDHLSVALLELMALKAFGCLKMWSLSLFVCISFSVDWPNGFKRVRFQFRAVQMSTKPIWDHSYFVCPRLKKLKNLPQTSKQGCFFAVYCGAFIVQFPAKVVSLVTAGH